MGFAKRLTWFLFGSVIGIFFVYGLFGNRTDISCNYFPDARVKGDLLKKVINYDATSLKLLKDQGLDSTDISQLLKDGDVVFSKSDTKLDSCKIYYIENNNMNAIFENCDSIVNILTANKVISKE